MKTSTVKIIIDALMFKILILELVPTEIVPVPVHFIAGLISAALFVVHILLNGKWCVSVTRTFMTGKLNQQTKTRYITDWLLLVIWILAVISGFPAMGYAMGEVKKLVIFRNLHVMFAILGSILIAVHLLQHKSQIRSYIRKKQSGISKE